MTTFTFDTHNFIARLKEAGMEESQAVAITEGLKEVRKTDLENVATKEDIAMLELKIETVQKKILFWLIPLLLGQVAAFALVMQFIIESSK